MINSFHIDEVRLNRNILRIVEFYSPQNRWKTISICHQLRICWCWMPVVIRSKYQTHLANILHCERKADNSSELLYHIYHYAVKEEREAIAFAINSEGNIDLILVWCEMVQRRWEKGCKN